MHILIPQDSWDLSLPLRVDNTQFT